MSQSRFVPYLQDEKPGVIVVSVFSLLSSLALVSVACHVLGLVLRSRWSASHTKAGFVFFNTQLGRYAACLLAANFFMEGAGLIGIHWFIQGGITEGTVCTVQAILSQIGNWANAYFIVIIAVHTFNSLVLRKHQSTLISAITISVGWILAGLLAGAPLFNPQAYKFGTPYGVDGLSCGIRSVYLKAIFFFHLFPIFFASVFSAILHSIIFLVLRGTMNIKGGVTLTLNPKERWTAGKATEHYHRFVTRIARSMLWYPIGYIVLFIPYSVTRLLQISGFFVSFGSLVLAYTCWSMLGIVNVLLLYNTLRVLGPAFNNSRPSTRSDNNSFGTPEHLRSKARWGIYKEKGDQYISAHSPEQKNPERATIAQSFNGYTASPHIERAIAPVEERNRTIASFESENYSSGTQASNDHPRQGSAEFLGLPAPPRRTRAPLLRLPNIESSGPPVQAINGSRATVDPRLWKQTSYHTLGKPDSPHPILPVELSPARLRGTQSYDRFMMSGGTRAGPMLGAFNSRFPSPISVPSYPAFPRHSRSLSALPKGVPTVDQQRSMFPGNANQAGFAYHGMHSENDFERFRI